MWKDQLVGAAIDHEDPARRDGGKLGEDGSDLLKGGVPSQARILAAPIQGDPLDDGIADQGFSRHVLCASGWRSKGDGV